MAALLRMNMLLALCLWVHGILSQTTTAPNFLGYAVEDQTPVTSAACKFPGMQVFSTSRFLYCEYSTAGWVRTACDGNKVLYSSGTSSMSAACDDGCATIKIVENWPSGGETWTMFDCKSMAGLKTPVNTLYRSLPNPSTSKPASTTAHPTSKAESIENSDEPPMTVSSEKDDFTSETDSSLSNNAPTADETGNKSLSGGAIAGIIIGGLAGVGIIVGAVFLGICIGRKKSGQDDEKEERQKSPVEVPSTPPAFAREGTPKSGLSTITELSTITDNAIEMEAVSKRYELPASNVHELDGVSTYNHV